MMHPSVTMYTGKNCPYCLRAKQLLNRKGVTFQEIDITLNQDLEKDRAADPDSRNPRRWL